MKKLVSLALCLVVALSLSATVFATTVGPTSTSEPAPSPSTANTTVNFTVAPQYTVTIPESVNIAYPTPQTADVTISDSFLINEGKKIHVTITKSSNGGDTAGGSFKAKVSDKSYELAYTITSKPASSSTASNVLIGGTVGDFYYKESGGTYTADKKYILTFTPATAQYAGAFADTITFTLGLADIS